MTYKLTGFALALIALAGCPTSNGEEGGVCIVEANDCRPTNDPCTENVCIEDRCVIRDVIGDPTCVGSGELSGELYIRLSEEDQTSFIGYFDDRSETGVYLAGYVAQLAAPPIDGCLVRDNSNLPPVGGIAKSMGTLSVVDAGAAALLTLEPSDQNSYFGGIEATELVAGELLSIELGGSADVPAQRLPDVFEIVGPPVELTDPFVNERLELRPTIHYGATNADLVIATFNVINPPNFVTTDCRLNPAGGAITLDQAFYDSLHEDGGIDIRAINLTLPGIESTDGVDRAMFAGVERTHAVPYSKPLKP